MLAAAASYDDDPLKALVHALKFEGVAGAARPLAEIMVRYVERIGIDLAGFVAMPLPLSQKRRRSRGFNQSTLIARAVAAALGLPFTENILTRVHHRPPQSETKDIFERKENIRGCFALHDADAARGKNVLLVDDVTTSGTTFTEAARTLKTGGAKKIIAFAAAKA
jgi:ComF family protein